MSSGLLKSTAVVSAMTLISRVLGFARDMVVARAFDAGLATDAFFVAFKIPNFLRRLFAEGAFSQAFVPVLSEVRTQQDEAAVKRLADHVAGTLGLILLAITVLGVIGAPIVIAVFAPGFHDEPDKQALAIHMLRFTFPYLFFISLTAFAGGILNTYSRFAIPAFTPVFLNIVLIAAVIWGAPQMDEPIMALAIGVFIAGAVQLAFQIPSLHRLGLLPRPRWGLRDPGVKKILRLMTPALFGSSVAQINLLIDTLIASFLVTGSISWLYFSDRLMEFPLGLFGVALATVILPSLSKRHAETDADRFSATLDWGLRWAILISVPAMLALVLMPGPLLTTLFHYGEFSESSVYQASLSLIAYGLGLPGFVLIKVLAPGFFSRQDTKTPVRIGVIAMFANMALNIALVFPLAHAGLALATAIAAWINAGLLFHRLRHERVYRPSPGWVLFALRIAIATSAMGLALFALAPDPASWIAASAAQRSAWMAIAVGGGAAVYALSLLLMGMRPRQLLGRSGA